jgi:hypothetical protein
MKILVSLMMVVSFLWFVLNMKRNYINKNLKIFISVILSDLFYILLFINFEFIYYLSYEYYMVNIIGGIIFIWTSLINVLILIIIRRKIYLIGKCDLFLLHIIIIYFIPIIYFISILRYELTIESNSSMIIDELGLWLIYSLVFLIINLFIYIIYSIILNKYKLNK